MPRARFCTLPVVAAALAVCHSAAGQEADELSARWRRTRDPQARARLNDDLVHAAILTERRDIVEEVAAGSPLARKEIRFPHRARRVPLREVMTFDGIKTTLGQEDG